MRTIGVDERRARLGRRHCLAAPAADVVEAARAVVCLHATDPATVYLSAWARVAGLTVADLDRALYVDRTLVKHLAMRRTLFVFPRDVLGDAQAGASARVADTERRRLARDVEAGGLYPEGAAWLASAGAATVAALADGREATSTELRAIVPELSGAIAYAIGKSWGGQQPVGPRVLTVLSASGEIVRASNTAGWNVSRPRWASMRSWLGSEVPARSAAEGVAGLVSRWLRAFGPGTEADVKWWLGSTLTAVRKALADVRAVEVDLDGRVGYLLPDDVDPVPPVEPRAALLPGLDPTTMGWLERGWYLGEHKAQLFDTNGNAGPTIWWDGRIVGGWRQSAGGEVVVQLLEDVGADGVCAIEAEAVRLGEWLGGVRVMPRFPSPLSKTP